MINPEARDRLADLMEQRRVDLRLTWRDVAEAGGISYEALRAARNGIAGMRPLTRAGIEDGLRWERGSIARILAGGDPVPIDGVTVSLPTVVVPPRRPLDDGPPLSPPAAAPPRRNRRLPALDAEDEEGLRPYILAVRRNVLEAAGLQAGPGREVPELPEVLVSLPGALIFTAEHEVRIWDSDLLSAQEKERLIALLRRLGAEAAEGPGEANAV